MTDDTLTSRQEELKTLTEYEQLDVYVFHGSGLRLHQIRPSQAYTVNGSSKVADGPPAVFASQLLDYAIFMALINPETCPDGLTASANYENGHLLFAASQATLAQLDGDTLGYVHVLHRKNFVQRSQTEWLSFIPVEPLAVFEVTLQDFKPKISKWYQT